MSLRMIPLKRCGVKTIINDKGSMDYKIENALFFLIGMSEYDVLENGTSLEGRPFVKAGLNVLAEALKLATDNKKGKNVISIPNPKNAEEITDRLRDELNEKQNSGTEIRFIFFYYCGHGMLHEGKIHYMTTATCTLENYKDEGKHVKLASVFQILSDYKVAQSATIFALIDSCYSGAIQAGPDNSHNSYILASCKWNKKSSKGEKYPLVSEKIIEILNEGIGESDEECLTIGLVAKQLEERIIGQEIYKIDKGKVGVGDFKFAKNQRAKKISYEGYKPINRKKQHSSFQRLYENSGKLPKTTLIIGPHEELANELIDRFIHYHFCDKSYFDNRRTYDNSEGLMPKGLSYKGVVDLESFNLCTRELAYSFGIADRDVEITADKLLDSKPHEVILCTLTINLRKTGFSAYWRLKKFISWYCNQFWPTHLDQLTSRSIYLFVNIITPHYTEGYGRKPLLNRYLSKDIKGHNTEVLYLQKVLRQDLKDYLFEQRFDTNGSKFSSVLEKIEGYEMRMNMLKAQERLKLLLEELQKLA